MNFQKHSQYRRFVQLMLTVWIVMLIVRPVPGAAELTSLFFALVFAPALGGTIAMACFLFAALRPTHRKVLLGIAQIAGQFSITLDAIYRLIPGNPAAYGSTGHLFELGVIMLQKGDNKAGLELLKECQSLAEKQEPDNRKALIEIYNLVGCAQRDCGLLPDSLLTLQKGLDLCQNEPKKDNLQIATILADICATHSRLGQTKQAEDTGERALEMIVALTDEEMQYGKDGMIAITMNNLGCVYDDLCKYEKAYDLYKRALELKLRSLGEGDPAIGIAHINLSSQLNNRGKHQEALEHAEKGLEILRKAGNSATDQWADGLQHVADAQRGLGNYEAAEQCFTEAIPLREKLTTAKDPSLAYLYAAHARLCEAKGDFDRSRARYQQALSICQEVMGSSHPQTLRILKDYACLLEKMGDSSTLEDVKRLLAAASERHDLQYGDDKEMGNVRDQPTAAG